jgi:hypothetical protein
MRRELRAFVKNFMNLEMNALSAARIELSLPDRSYRPAEVVSGYIDVSSGAAGEIWFVEAFGYERVGWMESTTFVVQGFAQTYIDKPHGETRLFHRTARLEKPDNFLIGSQYRIPWKLTLPGNIPGSINPHIVYKVRAFITQSEQGDGEIVAHSSKPLQVVQETPVKKTYQLRTEAAISNCLFCNRGTVKSRLSLDRPWYNPQDIVKLSYRLSQSSKVLINELKATLLRQDKMVSDEGARKQEERAILSVNMDVSEQMVEILLPSDLESSIFGRNFVRFYVLDVHVGLDRGTGPALRIPLIVLPRRSDFPELSPVDETRIESLPYVDLSGPDVKHEPSFSLKDFPHVSETDDLARSSSMLSRSLSTIKAFVKSGTFST